MMPPPLPDVPNGSSEILSFLIAHSWMKRLFGPSVDAVAESLKRWADERLGNVERVANIADRRREEAGDEGNALPLRVASAVFDNALYADDPIVADYLGGVLASSWSESGEDDRGVTWAAQIARMSSDMLRVHYLSYEMLRRALAENHAGDGRVVRQNTNLERHKMLMPTLFLAQADGEGEATDDEKWSWLLDRAPASLLSLQHEGLIAEYETGQLLEVAGREVADRFIASYDFGPDTEPDDYLVCGFTPTPHGVQLFLVAHGLGRHGLHKFVSRDWPEDPIAPEVLAATDGDDAILRSKPCCTLLKDSPAAI